jgi:hypothetical protein
VTKDVLQILVPGTSLNSPDSIWNQGWARLPQELAQSGLFLSHHLAFLPYIVRYLDNLGLSVSERQEFMSRLGGNQTQERCEVQYTEFAQPGRIPSQQFYRSSGGAAAVDVTTRNTEERDSFFRFLGKLLPSIADILAAFRRTSIASPSIVSQDTELTESSGVSSLVPKKSGSKQATRPQRGVAPRQDENLKRKSTSETDPAKLAKKRQVLQERN